MRLQVSFNEYGAGVRQNTTRARQNRSLKTLHIDLQQVHRSRVGHETVERAHLNLLGQNYTSGIVPIMFLQKFGPGRKDGGKIGGRSNVQRDLAGRFAESHVEVLNTRAISDSLPADFHGFGIGLKNPDFGDRQELQEGPNPVAEVGSDVDYKCGRAFKASAKSKTVIY